MSGPQTRIAALLLAAMSALLIWWGWKQGAYFDSVFYPGALLVYLLLGLVLALVPLKARLRGPSRVALFALLALVVWMLLSALWSPIPAAAVRYAHHGLLYLAVFAIGLWATNLLGPRMLAAMTPLAIAGAVIGVATVIVLATGTDVTWYLHEDATLRFPIGYRNANAAFFLICLWPLLSLVVESKWRWGVRALLIGAGTVLFELAFLAQSRGSIPAAALALVVFLALSRDRLRAGALLALVVLPALPALPTLLEVYRHGSADPSVVPLLRDAARAIGLTAALSVALAAIALASVGPRVRLSRRAATGISRLVAAAVLFVVVVGGSAFVIRHGGPVGFVDQRLSEFNKVGYPDLHSQGIRYGANVGSNRHDFWRVAAHEGLDQPLRGGGAGSFQVAYMKNRLSDETPEDPHSVEALMFSELGFPGLLLLFAFLGGATLAALRSRRLGPAAAALAAGSLAAGAQWLTQASFDWLWNYPGVTAPVMYLLGAAAAPALLDPLVTRTARLRAAGLAGLAVASVAIVPLYLSARYEQRGEEIFGRDPAGAVVEFDRAADLNPLSADPLLAKGNAEVRLGNDAQALSAFERAAGREPESFAAYFLMAELLSETDPAAARTAAAKARRLNPRDPGLAELERRLKGPAEK